MAAVLGVIQVAEIECLGIDLHLGIARGRVGMPRRIMAVPVPSERPKTTATTITKAALQNGPAGALCCFRFMLFILTLCNGGGHWAEFARIQAGRYNGLMPVPLPPIPDLPAVVRDLVRQVPPCA